MQNYVLRRLLSLLPSLFIISLLTFGLTALVPGDPAAILAEHYITNKDIDPTPEQIEAVRKELGLDAPWPVRYVRWLWDAAQGDLGESLRTGRPVLHEIAVCLPITLKLALSGLMIGLLIALPVGILAAVHREGTLDQLSRVLALMGASVPSFWLATMLILLFSVRLGWLPAMGQGSPRHSILPSVTLGVGSAASLMRLIRASLLEELSQDYVRTARAKGLSERATVLRHALKPAFSPVLTVLGLQFGHLLGGAIIVETIFAWPGLGTLLIESIFGRDFMVVQGFALFAGLIFVFTNFAVDIAYRWLDPRVQYVA